MENKTNVTSVPRDSQKLRLLGIVLTSKLSKIDYVSARHANPLCVSVASFRGQIKWHHTWLDTAEHGVRAHTSIHPSLFAQKFQYDTM